MLEGFHRGFRSRITRAKSSVQEYFRVIREQQVSTDFHVDRLAVGLTPLPPRRRNTRFSLELCVICSKFDNFNSGLDYLFAIAKCSGHDLKQKSCDAFV